MGFIRGKPEEEQIEEQKTKILNEGQVIIDLAVGTHGADEIIAGAMMGETGKYLAMAKYGKTKWQATYLLIMDDGIQIYYNAAKFLYNEIKRMEVTHKGWLDTEFLLHTTKGPLLFKLYNPAFKALKIIINDFKEKYLKRLEQEKINSQHNDEHEKSEAKIDRLIQLGKMHENGLLSDEEFASMKQDILNDNEENVLGDENLNSNDITLQENTKKFCENCGKEILDEDNFCINCGYKLK